MFSPQRPRRPSPPISLCGLRDLCGELPNVQANCECRDQWIDRLSVCEMLDEVFAFRSNRAADNMRDALLLRDVEPGDLPVLFEHQCDPEATSMAAFPAREWDAFEAHWNGLLDNDAIIKKTILFNGQVAGNIVCFEQSGRRLVGYWIGRRYWGKGIATKALSALLACTSERPLHAHVAKRNRGSIRVLEKCGFVLTGEDSVPDGEDGEVLEEYVYTLME